MPRLDHRLTAILERHLDGPPTSLTEPDWNELVRVVRGAGVWHADDETIRGVVERHALYLVLSRSRIPGLDPGIAQELVERFGSVAELASAGDAAIARAAPTLPTDAIERVRQVLTTPK